MRHTVLASYLKEIFMSKNSSSNPVDMVKKGQADKKVITPEQTGLLKAVKGSIPIPQPADQITGIRKSSDGNWY